MRGGEKKKKVKRKKKKEGGEERTFLTSSFHFAELMWEQCSAPLVQRLELTPPPPPPPGGPTQG